MAAVAVAVAGDGDRPPGRYCYMGRRERLRRGGRNLDLLRLGPVGEEVEDKEGEGPPVGVGRSLERCPGRWAPGLGLAFAAPKLRPDAPALVADRVLLDSPARDCEQPRGRELGAASDSCGSSDHSRPPRN